jgi:hypothetical protein
MLRLVASAVLTVSLVGAGTAHADPPWSAPVTIASGVDAFWQPGLAFTGDGHALATLNASGSAPPGLTRVLAAEPRTSAFTEIGRAVLLAPPAPYGRGGVAYLRTPTPTRSQSIDDVKVSRLGASIARAPDSLGRFQPLARIAGSPRSVTARVAADPRGNVAAAWLQPRGDHFAVRVALRQPGHAFASPRTVAVATPYGDVTPLDLAYGANGDLIVVFQRTTRPKAVDHRTLRLAVRVKRHGRAFGPVQSLGPVLGSSSIATVVSPTGRAVVSWGTQDSGEGIEDPWTVRASVLHRDARRFSKAQLLDPGKVGYPTGPVTAAIGRDGTATVAWSGVAARKLPYPVRVATAGPAGRFGATAELAPNGATIGVVTAGDGTTSVVWGAVTDPEAETLHGLFASRRAAGANVFAPPEPISPLGEPLVNSAAAGLDPSSGRPAALWMGAPGAPPGQRLDNATPVQPRYSVRGG